MCQQSCSRTWFPHSERLPGHDNDYADTDGKQTEKPREKKYQQPRAKMAVGESNQTIKSIYNFYINRGYIIFNIKLLMILHLTF